MFLLLIAFLQRFTNEETKKVRREKKQRQRLRFVHLYLERQLTFGKAAGEAGITRHVAHNII